MNNSIDVWKHALAIRKGKISELVPNEMEEAPDYETWRISDEGRAALSFLFSLTDEMTFSFISTAHVTTSLMLREEGFFLKKTHNQWSNTPNKVYLEELTQEEAIEYWINNHVGSLGESSADFVRHIRKQLNNAALVVISRHISQYGNTESAHHYFRL